MVVCGLLVWLFVGALMCCDLMDCLRDLLMLVVVGVYCVCFRVVCVSVLLLLIVLVVVCILHLLVIVCEWCFCGGVFVSCCIAGMFVCWLLLDVLLFGYCGIGAFVWGLVDCVVLLDWLISDCCG